MSATSSPRDLALRELRWSPGTTPKLGGISVQDIADRYGTPLYVYDAATLRGRYAAVRGAFGSRVSILYALKANPNATLAALLRREGAGGEVASGGEIHVALRAGFSGSDLQFAGPGKNPDDLTLALQHGVTLNVESAAEYQALCRMLTPGSAKPSIALRVNPRQALSGSRMRMGGGAKKFGIDADELPELVRAICGEDRVQLRGLHVYAGTQSFDAVAWLDNAKALLDLARELEQTTPAKLTTLNFGGGFGVPCFEGDPVFDLAAAGKGLQDLIAADQRQERRYFLELGRYLVATCGLYLTRVQYLKQSAGQRHAIVDGGLHHHAAAAGIGSVIRRAFPIVAVRAPFALATHGYTIGGPLCTPADEFCADLKLPELEPGDLLAILVSGAYGLTFSNVLFLGHPTPAEVVAGSMRADLVRARGTATDTLRGQQLPEWLQ